MKERVCVLVADMILQTLNAKAFSCGLCVICVCVCVCVCVLGSDMKLRIIHCKRISYGGCQSWKDGFFIFVVGVRACMCLLAVHLCVCVVSDVVCLSWASLVLNVLYGR